MTSQCPRPTLAVLRVRGKPMTDDTDDYVTLTLQIKRDVVERAKAHVAIKDPRESPLGEWAGKMTLEEYLASCLQIYFEE